MAGYNVSNPSTVNTWQGLLQIAQTNKKETQSNDWFDLEKTGTSGNGKCRIYNVGYYLGMRDRSKVLMFSSGANNDNGVVKQKYTPFWAAENQTVGADKGDDSRAQELQEVGKAIGMSNYNKLAFAIYDTSGSKLTGTNYSLSVKKDQTTLDGTHPSSFTNNESSPGTVSLTNYPYWFSVSINLLPNDSGSIKTYYLVGCNANGNGLPSSIKGLSATSGYHFQNDSDYIVFKIQQKNTSVTFDVTPDTITFNSEGIAEDNDYFIIKSGGSWEVNEMEPSNPDPQL